MCASLRANHALRTVPLQAVASHAHAHDAAIWETLELCLGGIAEADVAHVQYVATLPAALGGLGLRSRFAQRQPHTGLHGLTRYRGSTSVPQPSLRPARACSLPTVGVRRARRMRLRHASLSRRMVGTSAPLEKQSEREPVHLA